MNLNHQKISVANISSVSGIKLTNKQPQETKANTKTQLGIVKAFSIFLLFIGIVQFSSANAANLLFRSNFGDGVALGSIGNFYSNGKGAQQAIIGTDKETGFSWPIKAFGASSSVIQYITVDPITPATIKNYISNEIKAVAGPDGKIVNELFQNVKIKAPAGDTGSQSPFVINRRTDIGDVTTAYITYWFRYPADLASKLDSNVPSGNWRTQFEFKTGGYDGLAYSSIGDYRVIINILKDKDGQLYWLTKGDSANAPLPKIDYWREENRIVPVPVDKWFKFEVYWHRSNDSDGRFWAAIDGQEIVDHYGPNMGKYNLPINRIMIHNAYSGGYATVEAHTTGLEIWDGFPCGVGVSCHNYDKISPSEPSTLTLKKTEFTSSAMVSLTWAASSDNVAVAGYHIYRNGTKIRTTTSLDYMDSLSSAKGTLYAYAVKAFDAAGNLSPLSLSKSVVY